MVRVKYELPGHLAVLKIAEDCMRRFERTRHHAEHDLLHLAAELNVLYLALELMEIPPSDRQTVIRRSLNVFSRAPAETRINRAQRVLKELQRAQRNDQLASAVNRIFERVRNYIAG